MKRLSLVIVLMLSLAAGCRLWQRSVAPTDALPVAHHLRVEQLVFHSDFELAREHRLVRELVAERDDICQTLGLPKSDELIQVYLFEDAERYGQYLMRHFPSVPSRRAFFLKTDTRLAVYAHWNDRMAEDLRHEVAHGYLHSVVPNLPLWLDEGLAEFFEVPRGQNGLNRPHLDFLADLAQYYNWKPDLGKLERLTDSSQMQQEQYAESWAWVYFMLHSEPVQREMLTRYLADLQAEGVAEPLSRRLAINHAEPTRVLGEYLTALNTTPNLR